MGFKLLNKKIESKYPLNLAYDWDNVGLLVGDFDNDIQKVLVVLEANEKVIDEAIQNNVDLIVTHHPFIFKKMNRILVCSNMLFSISPFCVKSLVIYRRLKLTLTRS